MSSSNNYRNLVYEMMLNVPWISFRDFVQDFLNFLFTQESWASKGEVSEPKYGVNLSPSSPSRALITRSQQIISLPVSGSQQARDEGSVSPQQRSAQAKH